MYKRAMAGTILCVFYLKPNNWNLVSNVMQNWDVFWFRITLQCGAFLEDLSTQISQWLPGELRELSSSKNEKDWGL